MEFFNVKHRQGVVVVAVVASRQKAERNDGGAVLGAAE